MSCFGEHRRFARLLRRSTTASNTIHSSFPIGEQVTRAITGNQDVQEVTNSLNTLNINQHEQSAVSQPRRTTWYDLPAEILLYIAEKTIIPQESTPTDQYPQVDEIKTNFGAIDKRARRAFFTTVQQHCIFIKLRFHNGENPGMEPTFAFNLQKYFSSLRGQRLFDASLASGYRASFVRMEFHDDWEMGARRAGSAVVCATRWNTTLVRSLLVAQRSLYKHIIIDCHAANPPAINRIRTIVQDTEKVTRGMEFVGIFAPFNVISFTQANYLSRLMRSELDTPAKLEIHEIHLMSICSAMQYKRIQTILPYAMETAIDHIRCFGRVNILRIPNIPLALQRVLYVTLVLKGFSAYLLLQPNTREQQSHSLFTDGSPGDKLLRDCLACTNSARSWLEHHGWTYPNKRRQFLLQCVFAMLQARAEYEVAVSRTATLPDASAISMFVRREQGHQLGRLDVNDHVQISSDMRATLSRMYSVRLSTEGDSEKEFTYYLGCGVTR